MKKNLLKYHGYHAEFDFSEEDGCFVGHVLGIKDTLAFDGDSIEELTQSFHTCIDEYIEMCQEIGKVPEKEAPDSISITQRLKLITKIFPRIAMNTGWSK